MELGLVVKYVPSNEHDLNGNAIKIGNYIDWKLLTWFCFTLVSVSWFDLLKNNLSKTTELSMQKMPYLLRVCWLKLKEKTKCFELDVSASWCNLMEITPKTALSFDHKWAKVVYDAWLCHKFCFRFKTWLQHDLFYLNTCHTKLKQHDKSTTGYCKKLCQKTIKSQITQYW